MKISFDLDGTYFEYPETFDSLAEMLQGSGHEVGILTNRPEEDLDLGFEPDFTFFLGLHEDDYSVDERCMEKAQKMMEEDIEIHYDDEAEYFPSYVTVIEING